MNRHGPNQALETTADRRENITALKKDFGAAKERDSVNGASA